MAAAPLATVAAGDLKEMTVTSCRETSRAKLSHSSGAAAQHCSALVAIISGKIAPLKHNIRVGREPKTLQF